MRAGATTPLDGAPHELHIQHMTDAQELAADVASRCIALRVRRLGRLVTRIYDDAMRPFGLTVAQFSLLSAMINAGRLSPAELGRRLDLEKSTVSRNLARMTEHGWIRAVPEARGVELRVEAAGRKLFERAHPAWETAQARAAELMTREALARG
jgi:DNA-binding MarR family transcriptional regulator